MMKINWLKKTISAAACALFLLGCGDWIGKDDSEQKKLLSNSTEDISMGDDSSLNKFGRFYYTPGMVFGSGLNSLRGDFLKASNCLEPFQVRKISERNNSSVNVSLVRNWKDFQDLLYFNGSVQTTIATQAGPVALEGGIGFGNYVRRNSQNVFMLVTINAEVADYAIESPKLLIEGDIDGMSAGTTRNLYRQNYEKFLEKCGDKFLQTFTTGGRYVGVIEIEAGNKYRKNIIELSVAGTYIPLQLKLEGEFKLFLEQLDRNYDMKFHVLSRGPFSGGVVNKMSRTDLYTLGTELEDIDVGGDLPAMDEGTPDLNDDATVYADVKYFIDDIRNFFTELKRLEEDDVPWNEAAFIVSYEKYREAAFELYAEDNNFREEIRKMYKMLNIYEKYQNITSTMEHMVKWPERYDFEDPGEGVLKSASEVRTLLRRVTNSRIKLDLEMMKCTKKINPLCVSFFDEGTFLALSMEIPANVIKKLPVKRQLYPATCLEFSSYYLTDSSEEVTLYLNGEREKPFSVRCTSDKKKEAPVSLITPRDKVVSLMPSGWPEAYIFFDRKGVVDEDSFGADFNFAHSEWSGETRILKESAAFDAVNIIFSEDELSINPYDTRYARKFNGREVVNASYGSLKLCSSAKIHGREHDKGYYIETGADISLTGTPFELPLTEEDFVTDIPNLEKEVLISSDGKNIKLKLSGIPEECHSLAPKHELRLTYDK